ncbi:hypothetical protein [Pyruvatibacter mobilis]|uniref:hypothetical protein n=1 Tax=Pyruvatibacter mobilis TaxID=1712261 RepID=UPI003BAF344F
MEAAPFGLESAFILGFHGCDATVAERILAGEPIKPSENSFDWLGSGAYFWERNPRRGLEFAEEQSRRRTGPKITRPAVIGAVIDPGICLDLSTAAGTQLVASAFEVADDLLRQAGGALPENSPDILRRPHDCLVINTLHDIRREKQQSEFDTVRGVFVEGDPVFPGAALRAKTHVQMCVRNLECIKGFFRVEQRFLK